MTRWVIDAATAQAAVWAREGLDLSLAVNVSPKNLEEADFVEYLLFCCAARGLDRARLELEITEGVSAARGGADPRPARGAARASASRSPSTTSARATAT